MKIYEIHPFGPRVGQYNPYYTNVAETIERERRRLRMLDFNPLDDFPELDIIPGDVK